MRSYSVEQVVLFFLIVGLPLLKSIVGFIRKRSLSSAEAKSAPGDNERKTSWPDEEDLPWSRGDEKSTWTPPREALPPALPEVSKVVPSTLQTSVWRTAAAPAERPVPPARPRQKQSPHPNARPAVSSALRQIPRDHVGQRRAIVLMAVFGPPRAIDPLP
jgi:hypothetical protein